MERLIGWTKADAWGPRMRSPSSWGRCRGRPGVRVWFGAHPDGPTLLTAGRPRRAHRRRPQACPRRWPAHAFGPTLPYLAKIIAPAQTRACRCIRRRRSREGYLREEVLGIERTDTRRVYRDMNHKPEMIYALTEFSALVGFRVPRKARQLLVGLEVSSRGPPASPPQLSTVRGGLRSPGHVALDEDPRPPRSASKVRGCGAAPASRRVRSPRRARTSL